MLFLTSFGKLVYYAQLTIEKGLDDLIKLKAIDSLEAYSGLSKDECDNIVQTDAMNNKHIYKLYTIPTFYNPNILQQI